METRFTNYLMIMFRMRRLEHTVEKVGSNENHLWVLDNRDRTISLVGKRGTGTRKRGIRHGKDLIEGFVRLFHHDNAMKSRWHARSAITFHSR